MSKQSRQTFRGVEVLLGGRPTPLVSTAPRLSSQNVNWEWLALEAHSTPPCDHAYHEHPTHFLQLQLKGPARYEWTAAGRIHVATANPGTIFVCPRGSYDHVRWMSPTERIALAIHPHLLTQALEESTHLEDVELPQHFTLRDRHIESLILALSSDLEDGSVAGPLYGESIATALAVYLQRRYGVIRPRTFQLRGGLPAFRLKRVLEYIQANIGEELRLSNLATIAGMSPHYFCELFKQSTGLSPHQYVLRTRVECAKGHLDHGATSIIEASAVSGFTDQSYFTKVFRRVVGVTPTQYRAGLFPRARKTATG